MAARLDRPEEVSLLVHQYGFFDDFDWYVSPHRWTSLVADSTPTVACDADGEGGIVQLYTDTTDENEVGMFTTNEVFKFAAARPIIAGARIQFTELTGNGANVAFGFGDALAANVLGDAGAGVNSAFTSCCFIYKTDGSTVWKLHTENGSSVATTTTTLTAGGSSYQTLEMFISSVDGSIDEVEVSFKIDGHLVHVNSNGHIVPVRHKVSYTSATQMDFGLYAKTGTSGEALTVNCDWIYAYQLR